jgi:hypothetical protein
MGGRSSNSLRGIAAGLKERGIPAARGEVVDCPTGRSIVGGGCRPFRRILRHHTTPFRLMIVPFDDLELSIKA